MCAILPLGKRRKQKTTSSIPGWIDALPWARCELGVLVEEVEDHRQVVDAERPERVLVRADDPEVDAVAVDAEHVAELAGVDQLLQLQHARVVEQQVARHQHAVCARRERDQLVHLDRAHRGRLLDEDVLAGLECPLGERVVGRHGRRDHDGVERVVGEQVVDLGRRARVRVPRGHRLELGAVEVADPGQVGEVVEVAGEVRAPVVEPDDTDPRGRRYSFQTFPSISWPFVALRKSTITLPRRTSSP